MLTGSTRPILLGVAAGLVSGLFGVGGGVIVVPGLVLWFALDQHRASGTSTATIVASATAAAVLFSVGSAVDWSAAGWIFVGSGVGAAVGATALSRVPEVWLTRAFTALLAVAAARLYTA